MFTYLDCIPCFVRQTLDAVRFVSDDQALHERVLRKVLEETAAMELSTPPPVMGMKIHRIIRDETGCDDPYRDVKARCTSFAMEMLPSLRRIVEEADDPVETALRLSIAGNIIDFGVHPNIRDDMIRETIDASLHEPLNGSMEMVGEALNTARNILFLADNAGEIVFDRLLIERLPRGLVTVAVKGSPVINDATMADAEISGLTEIAEVIDNGSDAPGTILEECSDSFKRRFATADLIIAKGQGNYETLSENEKNIVFLLKAKCPVIAGHIGCRQGSMVIHRSFEPQSGAVPAGAERTKQSIV